jgi:mRNA interferase HigB
LREFWDGPGHEDAAGPLQRWFKAVEGADWRSIADVRRAFGHADAVRAESGRTMTVFNVAGNKCRLIAGIDYEKRVVFVKRVMTHREYDGERWKDEL